jgi:hypothetical protein
LLKAADDPSFGVEVDDLASWTVTRDGGPELDTALADSVASVLTVPPGGRKRSSSAAADPWPPPPLPPPGVTAAGRLPPEADADNAPIRRFNGNPDRGIG